MPFDSQNYQPIPEGHRRLLVLAEFLETRVPPEHFNMDHWGIPSSSGEIECGTDACAMGWATKIPELHRVGMRFNDHGNFAYGDASTTARHVFGLSYGQFRHLFNSEAVFPLKGKDGALQVAARIRAFVAEQAKVTA